MGQKKHLKDTEIGEVESPRTDSARNDDPTAFSSGASLELLSFLNNLRQTCVQYIPLSELYLDARALEYARIGVRMSSPLYTRFLRTVFFDFMNLWSFRTRLQRDISRKKRDFWFTSIR
jgi:hypothetical protein